MFVGRWPLLMPLVGKDDKEDARLNLKALQIDDRERWMVKALPCPFHNVHWLAPMRGFIFKLELRTMVMCY